MIIAIDFDKTIHKYSLGWHDGTIYDKPITGAIEALIALQKANHTIIVHTCREQPRLILEWFQKWGCPLGLRLNMNFILCTIKPYADFYIDDRAIELKEDWQKVLGQIQDP